MRNQSKLHKRRRSYDMLELVRLEERAFQFLYEEGEPHLGSRVRG